MYAYIMWECKCQRTVSPPQRPYFVRWLSPLNRLCKFLFLMICCLIYDGRSWPVPIFWVTILQSHRPFYHFHFLQTHPIPERIELCVIYHRTFVWVYITISILDTVSSVDANQIYLVIFEKHCTKLCYQAPWIPPTVPWQQGEKPTSH